jgi:hypothetical protein
MINDGNEPSNIAEATVLVKAVNDPPLLDLNGEARDGTENVIYYNQEQNDNVGPIKLADTAHIEDVDDATLIGAKVTLLNRPDGPAEKISATLEGTNITASYSADLSEIVFSGSDTIAAYQKVLRTVAYMNGSQAPNYKVRKVVFSVEDASSGVQTSLVRIVYQPQSALLPLIIQHDETAPLIEEPNDSCKQALPIALDRQYSFGTEDVNDWFAFTLQKKEKVTVRLTEFEPNFGQLLLVEGSCGSLKLVARNAGHESDKSISPGELEAGTYHLWLINDGKLNQGSYKLQVVTR